MLQRTTTKQNAMLIITN